MLEKNTAQKVIEIRPGASEYLGPARVVEVHGSEVSVGLPGGSVVAARLALAYLYTPTVGDELLVIGRRGDHYVIGVLSGGGSAQLCFQGDVEIRAEGGQVRIAGDKGVVVEGPEVEVTTRKLRMVADSVVQRFSSVVQRVTGLLSVRAREAETVVEGSAVTRARSVTVLAEETASVNGKMVNLG